ncbi:histidine phosphatase superfamily [Aspergillus recurvatus]
MPADEFVAMVSHPHFLGNPLLKTQHFVGTTRWEKVDDSKIIGHHQMRVAHQKHIDVEMKKVVAKGHGHGSATVTYRKIDGEWKFAGIEPNTRWTEFGGEGIFGPPEGEENEVAAEDNHASELTSAVKTIISQCSHQSVTSRIRTQPLIPSDAPKEAHRARQSILSTISSLQTLLANPADFLHHLAVQNQLLACLQWLGEFQVLACIPLTGTVPMKDVADLAGVPETHLSRIVRMTATAGFLQEPVPGQVAHSALSAPFVTKPSYLDAVMFLAGTVAPSALQMPTSTQRFGPSLRPNETAYNLALNNPATFGSTSEQRPKLQRQWPAFLQYVTNDTGDRVTDLLSRLDHFRRGSISVVEVSFPPFLIDSRSFIRIPNQLPKITGRCPLPRPSNSPCNPLPIHQYHGPNRISSRPNSLVTSTPDHTHTHTNITTTTNSTPQNNNITIQHRPPTTPQPISSATLYILHLPSPSPTIPFASLATHILAELRAHLDILRSSPSATLILTPRLLPEPSAVHSEVEASARLRDLTLMQLANEREIELAEWMNLLGSVSDSMGRMFLCFIYLLTTDQTARVWAVYAYTVNGETIPRVFPRPRALTSYGAYQLHEAGSVFRGRYVSLTSGADEPGTRIENLSPYLLDNDDVKITSTSDVAVLTSAQAFMQGVYPPLNESFNTTFFDNQLELADGSLVSPPLGGYQYPSIITVGVEDPQSLMLSGQALCSRHAAANVEYIASKDFWQTYEESAVFYNRLHALSLSGHFDTMASSYANATTISEFLDYQVVHNESLLHSLSAEDIKRARWYAGRYVFATNGNTSASGTTADGSIRTIAGQGLASSILNAFETTIQDRGANGKMTLQFGNYQTAVSFISLLQLATTNPNFSSSLPRPGSSLVLELFSLETQLYVRFLLHNGTRAKFVPYPLFGHGPSNTAIPFSEFQAEMQRMALGSTEDWCRRCNSSAVFCSGVVKAQPRQSAASKARKNRGGISAVVAGVIGSVVTIAVLALIGVVGFFFCLRTKLLRKPSLGGFKRDSKMASDSDLTFMNPQWGDTIKAPAASAKGHERHGSWEMKNKSPSRLVQQSVGSSSLADELEEEWDLYSTAPVKPHEHV